MSKLRIKAILASKGMTIKGLAKKMGVTPQWLSMVMGDNGRPTVATLEKIATALEVPVSTLFTDYLTPYNSVVICPYCGGRVVIASGTPL